MKLAYHYSQLEDAARADNLLKEKIRFILNNLVPPYFLLESERERSWDEKTLMAKRVSWHLRNNKYELALFSELNPELLSRVIQEEGPNIVRRLVPLFEDLNQAVTHSTYITDRILNLSVPHDEQVWITLHSSAHIHPKSGERDFKSH